MDNRQCLATRNEDHLECFKMKSSKLKNGTSSNQKTTRISPRIFLNCSRYHSSSSTRQRRCKCKKTYGKVPLEDIRNLLHISLLGDKVLQKPRWCTVQHSYGIERVVLISIRGINSFCYRQNKDCFRRLHKVCTIETKVAFNSSKDIESVLFSNVPEMNKAVGTCFKDEAHPSSGIASEISIDCHTQKQAGRSSYLVSKKKMIQMKYPMKDDEGIVSTNHADAVTDSSPLFGLDCEMCQTSEGLELTKVCVIDETGNSVFCKLVKPRNPILNYLTSYSGITYEDLSAIETRLEDVQQALVRLLPSDAILVGQSIENDLWALHMYHPFCIDTSDMFTQTGHRVKLADLASFYLSRDIQNGEMGHDPYEDAVASLDLFKLKLRLGAGLPKYKRRNQGLTCGDQGGKLEPSNSLFQSFKDIGKSCAVVDIRKVLRRFENLDLDQVECMNDLETVKKATVAIRRHEFVCAQFHGLHTLLQGNHLSAENLRLYLQKLDSRVDSLYQTLPETSLLIILMIPADLSSRQFGRCFATLKVPEVVGGYEAST